MAFRKKYHLLTDRRADVWVISECENPAKFKMEIEGAKDFLWIGENENKGLGVISFNDIALSMHPRYNPKFRYVLPLLMDGPIPVLVFAIWAMPEKKAQDGYVGQVWRALNFYSDIIDKNTILTGDFNSNTIWDQSRKAGNHTDVVKFLRDRDIESLYHSQESEAHGEEEMPTLYLLKQLARPYHLDYCFISESLKEERTEIEIGHPDFWMKHSDHMPLFVRNLKLNAAD